MIEIKNKQDCCCCWACVQVCPRQCISVNEDEEGFLYPRVDRDSCIDCSLCEKVCPILNEGVPREPLKVYAAKNPKEDIRRQSSSGGVFTLFAEKIIDEGGVVFGARWNDNWEVVHGFATKKEDLAAFRGSKYVQSKIGSSFNDAQSFLKQGRQVLFSGTPCQIAGLRLFLRREYDNLITVDFICHGVPSPGVFRWYLQEELNSFTQHSSKDSLKSKLLYTIPRERFSLPSGVKIDDIRFRDKQKGWKEFGFALDLSATTSAGFENKESFFIDQKDYTFLKGLNYILRPSCYECKQRSLRSGSDITIADFWGIYTLFPNYDDNLGISAVMVNTNKGVIFSDILKDDCIETSYFDVVRRNSTIEHSALLDAEKRYYIFDDKLKKSFKERVDDITKESLGVRLLKFPRRLIYSILGKTTVQRIRKALNNVNS